jgi:hypothetical protein
MIAFSLYFVDFYDLADDEEPTMWQLLAKLIAAYRYPSRMRMIVLGGY